MAEAAKLEKGPSVMAPTTRGTLNGYILCTVLVCMLFLFTVVEIELEFETIPPEFPAADSVKDLFCDLVESDTCRYA